MVEEKLEIYDLNENLLNIETRKSFYKDIRQEFAKNKIISRQVKRVILLLMNSKGRIFVQIRSEDKHENPGLGDKTVGGHVNAGDNFNITVVRECAEELGFPTTIVPAGDFTKAIKKTDLGVIGILREVDYNSNFLSTRVNKEGSKFVQPYMQTVYLGYYDGAIKFIDGEASGIQTFSLEQLTKSIEKYPDRFTEDLKFMVRSYGKYLVPIKK